MNIEKERELFEVFYLKEFGDNYTCPYAQLDKRGGEYIDFHAQDTWVAWLASRNREGYVLVPVESLKEIIDCAYCHIYDRCVGNEGDYVIKHIKAMGIEDDD